MASPENDDAVEALFKAHRHLLDEADGGYICDMAPGAVRAFIEAVSERQAIADFALDRARRLQVTAIDVERTVRAIERGEHRQ